LDSIVSQHYDSMLANTFFSKPKYNNFFNFGLVTRLLIALQIFVPCYTENELTFASEKLSSSLYHLDWHESIISGIYSNERFFMENSKQPLKITAKKLYKLNLESFLTVLNLLYSFYNVLKTLSGISGKSSTMFELQDMKQN
jgi:7tm Odorant receptor